MTVSVSGLFVYPVKSLKGISLPKATLTAQGLAHDRRWMVINAKGGFLTQRQFPAMALIHTRLTESELILSRNDMADLSVPLAYEGPGTELRAQVWGDPCQTLDEGEEAAQWLQSAIGWDKPVRLVRMLPSYTRPQSQADLMGESTSTHFADAAPFLVANQSSLDSLNQTLEQRGLDVVPIDRFRPNILLSGLEPFAEHQADSFGSERFRLKICYPCERCIMTTIDQETAIKHPDMEPFNTLAEINPVPGSKRKPAFGENAILLDGDGESIRVGDPLVIES